MFRIQLQDSFDVGYVPPSLTQHLDHLGWEVVHLTDETRGGRCQAVRYPDLFDVVFQQLLEERHEIAEVRPRRLQLFISGLAFFLAPQLDAATASGSPALVLVLRWVLQPDIVHSIGEEQYLVSLFQEHLEVRRPTHSLRGGTRQVVDGVLALGYPGDVLVQRGYLGIVPGGVTEHQLEDGIRLVL